MENLLELNLGLNELSGSIPNQIGNLANLQYLDLSLNQLSGSIPYQLGNLEKLYSLILDTNYNLAGPLPISFINLQLLDYFTFFGTNLCEPQDPNFQVWLHNIPNLGISGIACPILDEEIYLPLVIR